MGADELVRRVLDATGGDVEPLVKLANYQETEWLEFKRNLWPGEEKAAELERENLRQNAEDSRKQGLRDGNPPEPTKGKLCWHTVRAVIAMANTHGGAVLVGVDDNGQPVGLKDSDPDNYLGPESGSVENQSLERVGKTRGVRQ